jgi:hypothetical protein
MGNGLDDNGTYNRMTRTLPKQPSRCTGVMTFYDQPNFQLFLKQVKKVIRTCVQEGRENELLDNNPSLVSAWNELQQQPVSMNLAKGRKIELVPQYDWERTSGPPFWRTTQITFLVQRKKTPAPPIPQWVPENQDQPRPRPLPVDPCSRGIIDCKRQPPPPPKTEFEEWYYCSEAGVKSVKVKKGQKPPPQADAISPFYPSDFAARIECFKYHKNIIDLPTEKKPPGGKKPIRTPSGKTPGTTTKPSGGDDLGQLKHLLPLFFLFGAVVFFGEEEFLMESMFEVFELENELNALTGERFLFELAKNRVTNKLSVNVIRNGVAENLETFIEARWQNGSITSFKQYERLMDLAHDVSIKMQNLDNARSLKFARKRGTWVRGQFIEDIYIQKKLERLGYVGLPDWFQGFDAYKQGSKFSVSRKGGKYLTTFYDPDLISIKSHEPPGGLRNINLKTLGESMDKWLTKMNPSVLEKKNIRVKQTTGRRKEVHLILLGDDDVSQFKDKIQGIAQLANQKGFNIKIIQYTTATRIFTSLR